jgi:predicted nuclease of predicted toxin-antitoxin system
VKLWLDNQLPPALARWMRTTFSVECVPVRELNLERAPDLAIFHAAREAQAVVMTKDGDFVSLLEEHGAPPQVIWVSCGNTSNAGMRRLIEAAWPTILTMIQRGETLIELRDDPAIADR